MPTKVNPIATQLKKLKKELFKGDYILIVKKLNDSGVDMNHNHILNAMNGRLQNTEKLTQIKKATVALIEERQDA